MAIGRQAQLLVTRFGYFAVWMPRVFLCFRNGAHAVSVLGALLVCIATTSDAIYISKRPQDMCAGIQRLAAIVTADFGYGPMDGALYCFVSRKAGSIGQCSPAHSLAIFIDAHSSTR